MEKDYRVEISPSPIRRFHSGINPWHCGMGKTKGKSNRWGIERLRLHRYSRGTLKESWLCGAG